MLLLPFFVCHLMGKKTESVIDYYVLFRDTEASPCQAEQLLIGGEAAYVWGYVGTLNSSQAGAVQDSFYSGLRRRFECEFMDSLGLLGERGVLDAINADKIEICPKSEDEKEKILASLKSSSRDSLDSSFNYNLRVLDLPKMNRSFVELVSLATLREGWQRVGCSKKMNPLWRTAAIWVSEKKNSKIDVLEKKLCPEDIERIFKSALGAEEYFQKLTARQSAILGNCVDIVNHIRAADGCEDWNIENRYLALNVEVADRFTFSPMMQAANWVSAQTVAQSTGESLDNLKKQRSEERGGKK